MLTAELYIIGFNLFVFIIAPFLPDVFYNYFVDTYVGTAILISAVLYSLSYGYLVTVSSFTGAASLYAESHARKAKLVKKVKPQTLQPEVLKNFDVPENVVPDEIHPEAQTPEDENVTFLPKEDSGENNFKPVDVSMNEKEALPTISLSKDAEQVYNDKNLSSKIE